MSETFSFPVAAVQRAKDRATKLAHFDWTGLHEDLTLDLTSIPASFDCLRVKPGWRLRAYVRHDHSAPNFVVGVPEGVAGADELHVPFGLPVAGYDRPYVVRHLADGEEVPEGTEWSHQRLLEGDGSPWSYLCASLAAWQLHDFYNPVDECDGHDWPLRRLVARWPPSRAKRSGDEVCEWTEVDRPRVLVTPELVTVRFHTLRLPTVPSGGLMFHEARMRPGSYDTKPLVSWQLATRPSEADWSHRAGLIWPWLVTAALHHLWPTYSELASVIKTRPSSVRHALAPIRDFCRENDLPPLTWIVVDRRGWTGADARVKTQAEFDEQVRLIRGHDWTATEFPLARPETGLGHDIAIWEKLDSSRRPHPRTYYPTGEQLLTVLELAAADRGATDEALYGICREHPEHASRQVVRTKVALVSRARGGRPPFLPQPKERGPVDVIADFLVENGERVDEIITSIGAPAGGLTPEVLAGIVEQHGRLTTLFAELTRGSARSFASKYLHFHRPLVPIYDLRCDREIRHWVLGKMSHLGFAPPAGCDADYYKFCVRFMRLYAACNADGGSATVKDLDALLREWPRSGNERIRSFRYT